MAFDGISGTGCDFGVLGEGDSVLFLENEGPGELCCFVPLLRTSGFVGARGGGNGEMDRAETEAE